jgi:hypothetical protein
MTFKRWFLSLVLLLPYFSVRASAQATTTGSLAGTVSDPSGSVIPKATLVLVRPATGTKLTQSSNGEGAFTFPDLEPGSYQLTVSAPGFSNAVYNNVAILTGRRSDLPVNLTIGNATEQIQVNANGELLETTSNTLSHPSRRRVAPTPAPGAGYPRSPRWQKRR